MSKTRCESLMRNSRITSACSTLTPKLPVIVSTGIAAAKSTLSSACPSSTKLSMSECTVRSIQLVIHHWALAGTNDGCTSARYRRCCAPPIARMLLNTPGSVVSMCSSAADDANRSPSRNAASHASNEKAEKCGRSGYGNPWKNQSPG